MSASGVDIHEQDQAYKRGLVLGLTMAEIIILILFCLLLALAAVFSDHRNRLAEQIVTIEQQATRIVELETSVEVDPEDLRLISILKEYWERHAPDIEERDYFNQLVLQVEELEWLRSELQTLVEKNRDLEAEASAAEAATLQAEELAKQLADAGIDIGSQEALERLEALLSNPAGHDWPPIITLSEADNFHFQTGSAELSQTFRAQLSSEIVPALLKLIDDYDVSVIEVVGHTDEQPIAPRPSNLDTALRGVLAQGAPIGGLIPADNAGLGLARAVSVAQVLAADAALSDKIILPLSGGQLIEEDRMTNWTRGGDVAERRRIEIRVRRPLRELETGAP